MLANLDNCPKCVLVGEYFSISDVEFHIYRSILEIEPPTAALGKKQRILKWRNPNYILCICMKMEP
jgi:hypothetical protein